MSFRHTYITEFLYKANYKEELDAIEKKLNEYGTVNWVGKDNLGYFHGVIKDLDSYQTKNEAEKIIEEIKKVGANIKIVFES